MSMNPTQDYNKPSLKGIRRELRTKGTSAEAMLWKMLKGKQISGLLFRRQYSVGEHVLDFYCPSLRLAIELDGAVHDNAMAAGRDYLRDEELREVYQIETLRFENRIVFEQPQVIVNSIIEFSEFFHTPPSLRATPSTLEGEPVNSPPKTGQNSSPKVGEVPERAEEYEIEGGGSMKKRTYLLFSFLLSIFLFFSSCDNDLVSNKYCNLPARFTFSPVTSISQLNTSCKSMGQWCTITTFTKEIDGYTWVYASFANPQGSTPWPLSKLDNYKGYDMGLSGFIVGLPNIPEMGESEPVVTCYDLACRNCYDNFSTTKRMTLMESGYAQCPSCNRTYNLNNTGQVSSGDAGKPLFRYRVYFNGNTLSINN
ncbi:MAG: DUF559 domain-containing protein [Bacteroidaceae bacterium]|nr:DUF559 domain-containing protein [Bacteroidaceae bacterium]